MGMAMATVTAVVSGTAVVTCTANMSSPYYMHLPHTLITLSTDHIELATFLTGMCYRIPDRFTLHRLQCLSNCHCHCCPQLMVRVPSAPLVTMFTTTITTTSQSPLQLAAPTTTAALTSSMRVETELVCTTTQGSLMVGRLVMEVMVLVARALLA